jgi:hypothetical protein
MEQAWRGVVGLINREGKEIKERVEPGLVYCDRLDLRMTAAVILMMNGAHYHAHASQKCHYVAR